MMWDHWACSWSRLEHLLVQASSYLLGLVVGVLVAETV